MTQNNKTLSIISESWHNIKNGDQSALGEIFQNHFQEIYFYGLKIVPNPELVKDVIQEIFVQFWEKRSQLCEVKNIKAYLLITLRRELIRTLKSGRFEQPGENFIPDLFTISIEDFLVKEEDNLELHKRLTASMAMLTPKQREIIFLRFYHNLDFKELASVLEMNTQSVRNLLFRALEKLRKDLDDLGLHKTTNLEGILFYLFSKKIN